MTNLKESIETIKGELLAKVIAKEKIKVSKIKGSENKIKVSYLHINGDQLVVNNVLSKLGYIVPNRKWDAKKCVSYIELTIQ